MNRLNGCENYSANQRIDALCFDQNTLKKVNINSRLLHKLIMNDDTFLVFSFSLYLIVTLRLFVLQWFIPIHTQYEYALPKTWKPFFPKRKKHVNKSISKWIFWNEDLCRFIAKNKYFIWWLQSFAPVSRWASDKVWMMCLSTFISLMLCVSIENTKNLSKHWWNMASTTVYHHHKLYASAKLHSTCIAITSESKISNKCQMENWIVADLNCSIQRAS